MVDLLKKASAGMPKYEMAAASSQLRFAGHGVDAPSSRMHLYSP